MRIALVHSFHGSSVPGGANESVLDQAAALTRAGHDVHLVAARTDDLQHAPWYAARCAVTVATGHGRSPLPVLRALAPDVVHVHNLFPNFGRAWTAEWTGPLVATLHNYRPLCAAAVLYRDGAPCTRCLDGDRWAGLRHGCYRGSRLATLPLAWSSRGGVRENPLLRRADRVVVLSERSRETYVRAGLPEERIALVPNFVPDVEGPPDAGPDRAGDAWVFAGRLTQDGGILDLLRRWPSEQRLDVLGTGPLEGECRAVAPSSVRFLGSVERTALRRSLPGYRGTVLPGRRPDGVPLGYPEALAAGLPVLAFEGSLLPRVVRAEGTGTVTGWDASLPAALAAAERIFPTLRTHCRGVYAKRYGEAVWVERTTALYASLAPAHGAEGLLHGTA
ncbi:glycosyltransferase family 4 protein [Streptomyces longispororuber]|uniref:glycosyltransferase family 4 protein n=1 Tax=Streptomyces longispororuber TaxID=68230 RepID=UPI0021092030|nr:glycosyltransferase family 4 protein [Streptomyces longispororuber]MCQ4212020.1 glycosyltransferase family 4 protein [Streptomyces longispororuber]